MSIEKREEKTSNETCMRCIETYLKNTGFGTFDYSKCTHCSLSQTIHQKDSSTWNGHCRFLR